MNGHLAPMTFRFATIDDCELLAHLNQKLIEDERHRIRRTTGELKERMRSWLASEYQAIILERRGDVIGYALFRTKEDEIYLRQFFIVSEQRRKGFGREAVQILRAKIWPRDKRLTVDVLVTNVAAIAFWRAVGYRDYALTLEILPDSDVP